MPLLADAYADVHLNTKTLDTDIDRVEKKLERAVERFQKKLSSVEFKLDTTKAIKRLRDLQISADKVKKRIAENVTLGVDVDQTKLVSDAEAARQIVKAVLGDDVNVSTGPSGGPVAPPSLGVAPDLDQSFDAGVSSRVAFDEGLDTLPPAQIPVDADPEPAQRSLLDIRKEIERLIRGVKDIPLDLDETQFLNTLKAVRARLAKLRQETASIDIDVNSADALLELAAVQTLQNRLDGDTARIGVEVVGTAKAVAELGIVNAAKEATDGDVNLDVDVNGVPAALAKLGTVAAAATATAKATASASGIGSPAGLAGIAGLAGLAAAFGPAIPGLLGAAAGFALIGGAATAAIGGVAALGVALNKVAVADLKKQFEGVRTTLVTAFQPVADLVVNSIAPRLLGAFNVLIAEIAPVATQFIAPIADSLIGLVSQFQGIIGPLAGPIGQGFAAIIDSIAKFVPVLAEVTNAVGGPFVNALTGLVDLLFGTASAATPLLVKVLDNLGEGARNLIGPFNEITKQVTDLFTVSGPDFGNIFAEAGPLLRNFIDGILNGIQAIASAVSNIGLKNILLVLSLIFPPLRLIVGAFLFLKDAVDIISTLFDGLGPIIKAIGEITDGVFSAATEVVRSFVDSIDFAQIQRAVAPALVGLKVAVQFLKAAAPIVGKVLAEAFNIAIKAINFLSDVGLSLIPILGTVAKFIVTSFANAAKTIVNVFKMAAEFLAGPFGDAIFAILGPIAEVVDAVLGTNLSGTLDKAKETIAGLGATLEGVALGIDIYAERINSTIDGAVEFSKVYRENLKLLQDGTITMDEFFKRIGLGGEETKETTSATEQARAEIEKLNAEYQQGKIDANKYYGELAKAVAKVLPSTAKAFEKLNELVTKPFDLDAGESFLKKQAEVAAEAAEGAASRIKSAIGSGGLGNFFRIEDDDVAKTESGAKRIYDSVNRWLGQGRLSAFIDKEAVDVGKSLDELIATLQLKGQNIARLRNLEALGFGNVAAQLATLNDDPEALRAALDQLFAGGTASIADFERRLREAGINIDRELELVGPALGAGLGKDISDNIDKANETVGSAIDKLTANIRLKGRNIRRLVQLEKLGAGALAEELATLNDDPEALSKALDQLFAGGEASIRAANSKIEAAYKEVEASLAGAGDRIAKALNFEKAKEGVEDGGKSIVDGIKGYQKLVFGQVLAFEEVRKLEAMNLPGLAELLVNAADDPETMIAYAAQLAGMSTAQKQALEDSINQTKTFLEQSRERWRVYLAENPLSIFPPEAAAKIEGEGAAFVGSTSTTIDKTADEIATKVAERFGQPFVVNPTVSVGPLGFIGGVLQQAIAESNLAIAREQAQQAGLKIGGAFIAGVSTGILFGSFSPLYLTALTVTVPQSMRLALGPVTDVGRLLGAQFVIAVTGSIVQQALTVAVGWARALALVIGTTFPAELKPEAVKIGASIVDGILEGIWGKQDTVLNQIGLFVGLNIIKRINEVLGISSPSKVMMTVGEQTAEGLIVGFSAGISAFAVGDAAIVDPIKGALDRVVSLGEQTGAGLAAGITSGLGTVTIPVASAAPVAALTAPTTGFVAAPVPVVAAGPVAGQSDTVVTELRALRTAVEQTSLRPLIGEYKVETTKQPQSPEQLAADAAFVKALLL